MPFIQDNKLAAYMTRPSPPNFGQGFASRCLPTVDFSVWFIQCHQNKCITTKIHSQRSTQFPHSLSDEAQKVQYEDWLRETQKLLQMQQKFLEEQIGAHRKSKKALSAKQRTAKKAGREFPEEDAEQLKHVTEQQGVVQKQLEQVMQPYTPKRSHFVTQPYHLFKTVVQFSFSNF